MTLLPIFSCTQQKSEPISNSADYQVFLAVEPSDLSHINKNIILWKGKIKEEPKGFIYYEKLGAAYSELFEKTGEVQYLHKADSTFAISQKLTQQKWKVPSLLSLSSISIKKHDFESAAKYAVEARELTDEKFGPLLMQFDAEMELGNYQMAYAILKENRRMESFDYLVRLSKYKDYEGDLDSAIYYMEEAHSLIKRHQKERLLWATANLGDMYGHAGRIQDSYQKYLDVLAMDSTYDYALKGIAWVAFSHDGKTNEAREILENLQAKTAMPDYYLPLAEIYEYEGNEAEAEKLINQFVAESSKPQYGGMYNKYLIEIYSDRGQFDKALALAQEEITNRPTPAAYDWLAWTLHKQGNTNGALEIYQRNVEGKTFEPDVIYHMGTVYHAAGDSKAEKYLEESLEASYELGPMTKKKIKSTING